jgi:tripartite-type tricarboxylate transporter receptor subunit TctC
MSTKLLKRFLVACLLAVVTSSLASLTYAQQEFPNRAIRIVVPVAPGYNTDAQARILAEELRKKANVPVVVENRAGGAGGSVGADYVAHAAPDGYTLLFSSSGPLSVNKLLYKDLGYDPLAFAPISLTSNATNVLLVRADAQYKTLQDLIAFAKANPGKLNYGSGGIGTSTHLASELLKTKTGTDIAHIPFKGSAATITGLLSGQIDIFIAELGMPMPHINGGRVHALGVGSSTGSPLLPDVPPISDILPGFTSMAWYGLVAPPNTPKPIIDKLATWTIEIMKQPDIQAKIRDMGGQAVGLSPDEFGKFVKDDLAYWQKVIADAKIPAQ